MVFDSKDVSNKANYMYHGSTLSLCMPLMASVPGLWTTQIGFIANIKLQLAFRAGKVNVSFAILPRIIWVECMYDLNNNMVWSILIVSQL